MATKNRKTSRLSPVVLFFFILFLTGCSGRLPDISSRAIASAVAVAPGEEGMTVTAEYLEKVGADEIQRYGVAQATGKTFGEAVATMEREMGHRLYLDSCPILLVGNIGHRDQLTQLLTQLDGDRRIRPMTLVALAVGDPGELILSQDKEETSVGQELKELLGSTYAARQSLKDCLNLLQTPGRGLVMPLVDSGEKYAVVGYTPLDGSGLGWDATAGALIPLMGHDSIPLTVVGEGGETFDLLLEGKSTWVSCGIGRWGPAFRLQVSLHGNLISTSATGLASREVTEMAEQALAKKGQEDYRFVVDQLTKKGGVDLLSLGKRFSLKYPVEWLKYEKNWEQHLQNLQCEILTTAKIKDQRGILS